MDRTKTITLCKIITYFFLFLLKTLPVFVETNEKILKIFYNSLGDIMRIDILINEILEKYLENETEILAAKILSEVDKK